MLWTVQRIAAIMKLISRSLMKSIFLYVSPHKNLGGVESCGVLLIRKSLIQGKPTFPGGGTVYFVKGYTPSDIFYAKD